MWNHNHHVASLSEIGRWLAERAEELGVTIVPETTARGLLVSGGRVVGIRTGDKGRGKDGEELPNFEPGSDIRARVTILAEGTQGHLAGIASSRFGLASRPQVHALGVKEVWEVPQPLNRVIHTMGWPLRGGKRFREFGGSFIYPLGDDKVAIGMVVGLDYTDATLSVHDLLQELKTHPFVRGILAGGTRIAWGAKTIPEGGFQALPDRFSFPGGMIVGDSAGFVNVPALKGVHYAMKSGMLAAEAAFDAVSAGAAPPGRRARSTPTTRACARATSGPTSSASATCDPAFKHGFVRGALRAGISLTTFGKLPPGTMSLESDSEVPVDVGDRRVALPEARRRDRLRQAFERLSLREQDARRRAQPHPRRSRRSGARSPRRGRTCAPPRSTRSRARRARRATSSRSR